MAAVDFSFPASDLGTSGQRALRLRLALLQAGLAPEHVFLRRNSDETMDAGSIVEIVKFAVEYGALLIEVAAIAHTIYDFCKRERSGITVKTSRGQIEIGPGEIDIEQLRLILTDSPSGDANRAP